MEEVLFKDGDYDIGLGMFKDCEKLKSVSCVNATITDVSSSAFENTSIEQFPFDHIEHIGESAFSNTKFTQIEIDSDSKYLFIDADAFNNIKTLKRLIVKNRTDISGCFDGCSSLEYIYANCSAPITSYYRMKDEFPNLNTIELDEDVDEISEGFFDFLYDLGKAGRRLDLYINFSDGIIYTPSSTTLKSLAPSIVVHVPMSVVGKYQDHFGDEINIVGF